ncbi:MAG: OmpA family protein, partial [Elusimicrobiota bacterium]
RPFMVAEAKETEEPPSETPKVTEEVVPQLSLRGRLWRPQSGTTKQSRRDEIATDSLGEEEIIEIVPGILDENIQSVLHAPRAPEIATSPPKPLVSEYLSLRSAICGEAISQVKEVKKDTIITRVFFGYESDELSDRVGSPVAKETQQALNQTIDILKNFPENKVVIEGHTCNYGGAEMNEVIAVRRAMAINTYLVQNGIDATRTTIKSFAYKKPVAKNDTSENRAQNRRVDVIIMP